MSLTAPMRVAERFPISSSGGRLPSAPYAPDPPPDWPSMQRQEDRFLKQMEELAEQMVQSSVQEQLQSTTPLEGLGPPTVAVDFEGLNDDDAMEVWMRELREKAKLLLGSHLSTLYTEKAKFESEAGSTTYYVLVNTPNEIPILQFDFNAEQVALNSSSPRGTLSSRRETMTAPHPTAGTLRNSRSNVPVSPRKQLGDSLQSQQPPLSHRSTTRQKSPTLQSSYSTEFDFQQRESLVNNASAPSKAPPPFSTTVPRLSLPPISTQQLSSTARTARSIAENSVPSAVGLSHRLRLAARSHGGGDGIQRVTVEHNVMHRIRTTARRGRPAPLLG